MTRTFGALLDEQAASLVGRDAERAALLSLAAGDGALVAFVHGVGGVGKSALLKAFAADARAHGATVVALDARSIEPTEQGLKNELARVVEQPQGDLAAALGALGERVVLVIDTFELLWLLEDWLRVALLPTLPDNVRVVLAGRDAPTAPWYASWGELLLPLPLANLAPDAAHAVLRRAGLGDAEARRLNRLAHGHPLSLQLAAAARKAQPAGALERVAVAPVAQELARVFLDELDPQLRRTLDAAAVVRRTTISLLAAMLPDEPPGEAFERLGRLPFVELGRDGLVVHDTVREVLADRLRAADPARHHRLRAAAWRQLRREDREGVASDLWRYTADMLYLVENPIVRDAFFPPGGEALVVDDARAGDAEPILGIARDRLAHADADALVHWWEAARERVRVARDGDGRIAGFSLICEPSTVGARLMRGDPVSDLCHAHLRNDPAPPGQRVLFARYSVTRDAGSGPAQAALWLDAKRLYMELRPALRRMYVVSIDPALDAPMLAPLGFRPLPGEPATLAGATYHGFVLDFGPASIDGWLGELVGAELAAGDGPLDVAARQLVLDGERVDLTRLECDVLDYLRRREGAVVRRDDLLRDVWGYEWTGGSNVVDVVVSSLRKKLGSRAGALATVRGAGYRLGALD